MAELTEWKTKRRTCSQAVLVSPYRIDECYALRMVRARYGHEAVRFRSRTIDGLLDHEDVVSGRRGIPGMRLDARIQCG